MKKSSKFSKDFPTRKNHYAIRKFTVGTASIIVGSFLFFGQTQAHAEQAEEFERVTTGTVDTGGQLEQIKDKKDHKQARIRTIQQVNLVLQVKMHQMKIMLVTKMLQ